MLPVFSGCLSLLLWAIRRHRAGDAVNGLVHAGSCEQWADKWFIPKEIPNTPKGDVSRTALVQLCSPGDVVCKTAHSWLCLGLSELLNQAVQLHMPAVLYSELFLAQTTSKWEGNVSRRVLKHLGECTGAYIGAHSNTGECAGAASVYPRNSRPPWAGWSEDVWPKPAPNGQRCVLGGSGLSSFTWTKWLTPSPIPCGRWEKWAVQEVQAKGRIGSSFGFAKKQHLFSMASAIFLHKTLCSLH